MDEKQEGDESLTSRRESDNVVVNCREGQGEGNVKGEEVRVRMTKKKQ